MSSSGSPTRGDGTGAAASMTGSSSRNATPSNRNYSGSGSRRKQRQQEQEEVPPHHVDTALPKLESAPTSAQNLEGLAAAAAQAASEQFQSAIGVLNQTYTASAAAAAPLLGTTPISSATTATRSSPTAATTRQQQQQQQPRTSLQLPPPPPPPPPPPRSAPIKPTVAPLPPPPIRSQQHTMPPPSLPSPPPPRDGHATVATPPPSSSAAADTNHLVESSSSPKPPHPPPPPFLPYTQLFFRTQQQQQQQQPFPITAIRQERLPVLIVATEHAHQLSWKNGLRISDLFQGLHVVQSSSSFLSDNNNNKASSSGSVPFRSLSKNLNVSPQNVPIQFWEELNAIDDETAAQELSHAALLQEKDGDLQNELLVLEDQIDNLLCDDDDDDDNDNGGNKGHGDDDHHHHGRRDFARLEERRNQVHKDAFQLTSPLTIPWLCRYRHAADACTDHMHVEQFQCPAIILYVSTSDEPLDNLQALQLYGPVQYRNGQYDPDAVRHEVLILHDAVDGPRQLDEARLRKNLQQQYGGTANVLRINSLSATTAAALAEEENTDLWGGGGQLGNCLNTADRARIRKYLTTLVTTSVLPALERRIADLNVIVSERKKGVRNVLKSFWGRSKSEEYEGAAAASAKNSRNPDVPYRFDSVESQTRLLADSLFLMKDYEAAYSMYRLIKDDFKQDKNWIHYGSVHEIMALSLYLFDPYGRSKEIFTSIETALLAYNRAAEAANTHWGEKLGRVAAAPVPTRLATRLCLVLISAYSICSGRHLEVADLLASASSHETALGAAVLLEQSSAHYFQAEMYRKYAFHMLMSGHMFRSADQDNHAFRCFTSALYIYRDGKWEELHNHLRSALAAQLFSMGRMAIALQLYAKLVGSTDGGRVSVRSQQKFVNNLLEICNDHTKKALAGADRMAAPPKLSGSQRDRFRQERLDRIVQVVRYTKSASRVLELPNINLPYFDDSSVVVIAEETARHRQENVSFGEAHIGSEDVWEELVIQTTAELKAASLNQNLEDTIVYNKTFLMIEDPAQRKVIALMDKEKVSRSMVERNKKSATYTDKAPIRAVKEPVAVQFTMRNPLGVPIDLCDLQLVARMTLEYGDSVCTNEDAVSIRPFAAANEKPKWTFQSSDAEFLIADFCRVGNDDREKTKWTPAEDIEPFFVVTKSNITLEAESKKVVSASICPLVLGELEVVGVRCRLFDAIWVYHPFDIKGPLLQDTRSNRAKRIRGESFLLKSKVEGGMPCLTVDFLDKNPLNSAGPALDSQVGTWILRISNIGTASASAVTLKTNIPWICFDAFDAATLDDVDQKEASSCCVGPTGTLMTVPVRGTGCTKDGELQPAETVEVPVKIRTTGTGKQDFYMLFRYELGGASDDGPPKYRWLKKMFTIPVYPALTLSATVTPAFLDTSEHILSLEVTNCRTDRPDQLEVDLETLAIASRHYRLERIPNQFPVEEGRPPALGWQERTSIHYRLVCMEEESAHSLLTHCTLSDNGDENSSLSKGKAALHFMCLERAHEHFDEALKLHQMALARAAAQGEDGRHPRSIASIRRANTQDSSFGASDANLAAHATSIQKLCPRKADTFHLICSWNAHDGSVKGSHFIRSIPVRQFAADSSPRCPLTMTAEHPSTVSNDFSTGPAVVPIIVRVRNRMAETSVSFEFAVKAPDSFDITGPERYKAALQGGEELSISLKALLPAAGVYDLQQVHLLMDGEDEPYHFPLRWMVTVNAL